LPEVTPLVKASEEQPKCICPSLVTNASLEVVQNLSQHFSFLFSIPHNHIKTLLLEEQGSFSLFRGEEWIVRGQGKDNPLQMTPHEPSKTCSMMEAEVFLCWLSLEK